MIKKVERKDKLKNKAKVIKEVLKDPTLTEREIAKKTGLSNGTAHNQLKDIEQNGAESNIMDRILANDDRIMDLANEITIAKIIEKAPKNKDGNIKVSELSLQDIKIIGDLANNSTKRKAIFGKDDKGDNTFNFIIS